MIEINGITKIVDNDRLSDEEWLQKHEKKKSKKCKLISKGQQITIPAGQVEFHNGGNTIWIHSNEGATTLRIKCTGKINVEQCKDSPVSHCDIMVQGDINFCISNDAK